MTTTLARRPGRGARRGRMPVRDVSLFVEVVGHGPPLVLMHGGPGADHWTMHAFHRLADQFTLIFYDPRCNGRSEGAPVSSMTWENLTADADALREKLGFERWAVLGHFLRRAGGARVRVVLPRPAVAVGAARHRLRQPLGTAEHGHHA